MGSRSSTSVDARQGARGIPLESSMPQGKLDPRLGDEKHVYGTAFVSLRRQRSARGDRRRAGAQGGPRRIRLAGQHAHDAQARRLLRGDPPRRNADPVVESRCPAIARRTDRLGVYYGFKSMNSHIHLLEALTELARVDDRPIVQERLRETFLARARPHRRRTRRAEPLPDARLAGDPCARLVRPRRRDGLSAGRSGRSPRAARRCPDMAGRPPPGRSCPRMGLGRRARRLLRQGRIVRRPGVRPEEGLVDPGRGPERALAHARQNTEVTPTATAKHSGSNGTSSRST